LSDEKELSLAKRKILDEETAAETEPDIAQTKSETKQQLEQENGSVDKVTKMDIDFVLDTICKEAKYDKASVRQLFFGMATAFTRLGMGHKVNSKDSGAGKSYLTNKVAGYFPEKYVLVLGGASNKAFQHKQGIMVIRTRRREH
jgi:hypothetical protein